MAYVDVRSPVVPCIMVRALVPKKADTSEYQISKPPCSKSSPIPVSCGTCGGGGASGGEGGEGGGGDGGGGEGGGGRQNSWS